MTRYNYVQLPTFSQALKSFDKKEVSHLFNHEDSKNYERVYLTQFAAHDGYLMPMDADEFYTCKVGGSLATLHTFDKGTKLLVTFESDITRGEFIHRIFSKEFDSEFKILELMRYVSNLQD